MTTETNHILQQEALDLGKLKLIISRNWIWLLLIMLFVNGTAIIYARYTKDIYESESEIKLDIKQDATELGIRDLVPERTQTNVIAAEIETIKSKLFLSSVIDSLKLDVTYLSIGKILNFDMHRATPFTVTYQVKNPSILNTTIFIQEQDKEHYLITVPGYEKPLTGTFGHQLQTPDFVFTINRTHTLFQEPRYAFVINSRENMLDYLQKNLTVEPLNVNANTIRVAFKDSNPYKAFDIVNGIDSLYLHYSNEQKNLANQQKIAWLNNELRRIEQQMEGYESYFENFIVRNRTGSVQDELKTTIQQINRLDSQRYELNRRISAINRLADALQTDSLLLPVSQRNLLPEPVIKNLERLQELKLETARLMLSYRPGTLAYRQKEQEMENLSGKIHEQLTDIKSNLLERLGELTRAQTSLERQFSALPDRNTQFNKQARYYKLYEELYLTLIQKKSEFEVAMAGSTPDFKILSTATLPKSPVSPKKIMVYAAGFVMSLFLSFVFTGIAYLFSDKITSIAEVEKACGLPLLGSIPAFGHPASNSLYVLEYPRSRVSEALRSLRTNLSFLSPDKQKKVITVSSTISGEGKSFVAANLSAILALSNKKVILLDMDMRKASSQPKTDIPEKGISTLLIGRYALNECIRPMPLENLHFIPPGPLPPNPAELLLNGALSSLLDELKKTYDFIVMDTPPVGLVTDGIMAIRQSDVALYVFRANYSSREFFSTLKRMIRINQFNHLAVVLNALPASGKTYGYGYYQDEEPSLLQKLLRKRV